MHHNHITRLRVSGPEGRLYAWMVQPRGRTNENIKATVYFRELILRDSGCLACPNVSIIPAYLVISEYTCAKTTSKR
jgi:hypothetical protein